MAEESLIEFDPVAVARHECDAWVGYYRRDWRLVLRAAYGMVDAGFCMGPARTLRGAWLVLRANQAWAPYPDNDPVAARALMTRFYALVGRAHGLGLDPAAAATLEVAWWHEHRVVQREDGAHLAAADDLTALLEAAADDETGHPGRAPMPAGGLHDVPLHPSEHRLAAALAALYAYVYDVPAEVVADAARLRTVAMRASDAWVVRGCDLADPLVRVERRLLVASYTDLRGRVERPWWSGPVGAAGAEPG